MFRFQGDSSLLLQLLHQANLVDFTVENESLEEQFMDLYGKDEQ